MAVPLCVMCNCHQKISLSGNYKQSAAADQTKNKVATETIELNNKFQ